MENVMNQDNEPKTMQLDPSALIHLQQTRKWTNFLSIIGFVMIGFLAILAFAVPRLSGMPTMGQTYGFGAIYTIIVLIFVVVYFFPIYYLYSFSRYARLALANNDGASFTEAMRYLKMHYRFMGILIIILLSIYALILIIALMAGSLISIFN